MNGPAAQSDRLRFRDPVQARRLAALLARTVDEALAATGSERLAIMHVCGSHEQAISKFGLRSLVPETLDVIMGPGCPVCVTDMPEIDEAVALADHGITVATYGDMYRVRGSGRSLADAHAEGAPVEVVYSVSQAVDLARATGGEVVFFACGFETTAVTTAAALICRRAGQLLRSFGAQIRVAGDGGRRADFPTRASPLFSPPATPRRLRARRSSNRSRNATAFRSSSPASNRSTSSPRW